MKKRISGISQFLTWPILFIIFHLFLSIKINGRENLRKISSPFIIISNHISFYDSFLFRLILGFFTNKLPLRFMAVTKFDSKYLNFLSTIGVVQLIYFVFGVFVVKPGRGLEKNLEEAEKIINDGGNILIYPEGSVNREDRIKPFKVGVSVLAKKTNVSVLPVSMRFNKKGFLRRRLVINIGEKINFDKDDNIESITNIFFNNVVDLYKRG